MKREINILWIEDNLNSNVRTLQREVKKIIEDALYEVNIFNTDEMKCFDEEDKNCGESILKDRRIDLIFSDNNLGREEGVDFLTNYRLEGNFKYYILYSNLNEEEIIEKIADRLHSNKQVHLFSNFDFMSLNTWRDRIDDAMDAFLNNRNKMEELRNIYIVENSIIEDELKQHVTSQTYFDQINDYCSQKGIDNSIKSLWHKVRKDRNALAHGNVTFENGYNIVAGSNGISISETEFKDKLEQLKELTDILKSSEIALI